MLHVAWVDSTRSGAVRHLERRPCLLEGSSNPRKWEAMVQGSEGRSLVNSSSCHQFCELGEENEVRPLGA